MGLRKLAFGSAWPGFLVGSLFGDKGQSGLPLGLRPARLALAALIPPALPEAFGSGPRPSLHRAVAVTLTQDTGLHALRRRWPRGPT